MRGASLSPRGKAEAEGAQAGEPEDGSAAAGEQQGTPAKPEEEADSSAPLSPASELSPRESGFSPRGSRDGEYAALTSSCRRNNKHWASARQQHSVLQSCCLKLEAQLVCIPLLMCARCVCCCIYGSQLGFAGAGAGGEGRQRTPRERRSSGSMPDSTPQACSQLPLLHARLSHLCKRLYMLCHDSPSNMLTTASGWICAAGRNVQQSIVLAMLAALPCCVSCIVLLLRTSAESADLIEARNGCRTQNSLTLCRLERSGGGGMTLAGEAVIEGVRGAASAGQAACTAARTPCLRPGPRRSAPWRPSWSSSAQQAARTAASSPCPRMAHLAGARPT